MQVDHTRVHVPGQLGLQAQPTPPLDSLALRAKTLFLFLPFPLEQRLPGWLPCLNISLVGFSCTGGLRPAFCFSPSRQKCGSSPFAWEVCGLGVLLVFLFLVVVFPCEWFLPWCSSYCVF